MAKVKQKSVVGSSWLFQIAEDCDGKLLITYKDGPLGPITVTCLYPGVPGGTYYDLLLVWASKGRFVWRVLPYKQPYRLVALPGAIGCDTSCALTSDLNPSLVGQTVTFTATISNTSGSATVDEGQVEFKIDGVSIATVAVTAGEASFQNAFSAADTYLVEAFYTSTAAFGSSQDDLTQTVNGGVSTTCCSNDLATSLTLVTPSHGTLTITWNGTDYWESSAGDAACSGALRLFRFGCPAGSFVLQNNCTGFWVGIPRLGGDINVCDPFHQTFGNLAYDITE